MCQDLNRDSANPSRVRNSDRTCYNINHYIFPPILSQDLKCDSANPDCLVKSLHFYPQIEPRFIL